MARTAPLFWLVALLAAWLVAGCTATVTPVSPLATVPARLPPAPRSDGGLLLVAVDGIRVVDIRDWMADGSMPAFATLAERGRFATLHPDVPTRPDAALALLLSEESITEHGGMGAGAEPESLTPFWAEDSKRSTAVVGPWPGLAADGANLRIQPGPPWIESALHQPLLAPAQSWSDAPPSFSPRLEAALPLTWRGTVVATLFLLAVDTLNDNVAAYDEYWVATKRDAAGATRLATAEQEWATLQLDDGSASTWLLLDGRAENLRLYQAPVVATESRPPESGEVLVEALGGVPPGPDLPALANGWLDAGQLREMGAQQSRWLATAAGWLWADIVERDGASPIMVVHWPAPRLLQRALPLDQPSQRAENQQVREGVAADHDRILASLLASLDLSRQTLFVLSPLGMEPALAVTGQSESAGGQVAGADLAGWWLAAGYGIRPGPEGERIPLRVVTATAARLLGLPFSGGSPLDEWLELP